jgi:hypothetical protein
MPYLTPISPGGVRRTEDTSRFAMKSVANGELSNKKAVSQPTDSLQVTNKYVER